MKTGGNHNKIGRENMNSDFRFQNKFIRRKNVDEVYDYIETQFQLKREWLLNDYEEGISDHNYEEDTRDDEFVAEFEACRILFRTTRKWSI